MLDNAPNSNLVYAKDALSRVASHVEANIQRPILFDAGLPETGSRTHGRGPNISPIFNLTGSVGANLADICLVSSDRVHFYVHSQNLNQSSTNAFGGLLSYPSRTVTVPEHSSVLNLVLHIVYGMPCAHHTPHFDALSAALDALAEYGVPFTAAPGQPLYALILAHAPYRPIDAYALAAHHALEDAAVAVSAHLLAYDTSQLSDPLTVRMGPLYLRRLLDLHQRRMDALKRIVLRPPAAHAPTRACGGAEQGRVLTQAWAFAAAKLAWDGTPSISTHALQSAFEKAAETVRCEDCRAMLQARIQEVVQEWSAVKRTI